VGIALVITTAAGAADSPGSASSDAVADDSAPPANITAGSHLASVTLEPGHRVHFFKDQNGGLTVAEEGRLDQAPRVAGLHTESVVETFKTLAPGRSVPKALTDAADAFSQGKIGAVTNNFSLASSGAGSVGAGPNLYTDGEQQWFNATFCAASSSPVPGYPTTPVPASRVCLQGWTWAHSGQTPDEATKYISWVVLGSEATATALFQGADTECPWYEPWCGGTNKWRANVNPGTYMWFSSDLGGSNASLWNSTIDNGGSATVSLADRICHWLDHQTWRDPC